MLLKNVPRESFLMALFFVMCFPESVFQLTGEVAWRDRGLLYPGIKLPINKIK